MMGRSYPNPFSPATTIAYTLPIASRVDLRIFDVSGRLVRVLLDGVHETAGRHEVLWDGQDASGRDVSCGAYFYRLSAGDYVETNHMVLVR